MIIISTVDEINRGGFGVIEEVICDDKKKYARKTFMPEPNPKITPELLDKFRQRFIREVLTQKRLPNELFIPILYEDLSGPNPWYLMPLAKYDYNHEIAEAKATGRKPQGLADILNSLEYIHNLGYVHRDLKPGNILFHDDIWKLSDFGLITHNKDIVSLSITSSNGLGYGTERYSAPEQIAEFKHVDNKADIYSFGAILHDIYTNGTRTPYSNLTGPGDIGIVIDKCTKRDPKQRFNDVKLLRNKLLYILSKNSSTPIGATLQTQINNIKDLSTFDKSKLEEMIFYLKDENADQTTLFFELSDETLIFFNTLDTDLFIEFSILYTEWVVKKGFLFEYCDVIIGFLVKIYNITENINLKAKCIISAAELGRSHNRWFVMENVIKLAGKDISDNLALRLQIEIDIDTRNKENFKKCADIIDKPLNIYHDLIAEVL